MSQREQGDAIDRNVASNPDTGASVLTLPGKRQISYAEYGDPHGRPIIYCHGFPASRLEARAFDRAGAELGARIIALDRPGIGRSDPRPGHRLTDWPVQVCDVADVLGLDRFALLGVSGGGPYAASCAHAIPDRLTGVGIVSGLAPLDSDLTQWLSVTQRRQRAGLSVLRRLPVLTRLVAAQTARQVRRDPGRLRDTLAPVDRAVLDHNPKLAEASAAVMREAFRQGSKGFAADLRSVFGVGWGLRPKDITVRVHLWHGELDDNVFVANGRALAAAIPDCHATFYADEGHLLFRSRAKEILSAIVPAGPGSCPPTTANR